MDAPKLLTVDEVAHMLGMTESAVRHLVYRRQIPHVKVGPKTLRFDPVEIADWLAERRVAVAG